MKYGSVCSGIEAASVAWEPLGWEPAWFAEIDPFASAVLAHRYPHVANLGDFTKIGAEHGPVDLLVGGTPCQSFSVAGRRAGLADPRGNLTLEYLALADRLRPAWLVWENVPGVLSIDERRTFGTFLGILRELGYGWAYRVLDAQFAGVPQRRRRVFVVGHLGDWRRAAAVLLERHSLQGHSAPSRETGQDVAGTINGCSASGGFRQDLDTCGAYTPVAGALTARYGKGTDSDATDPMVVAHTLTRRCDGSPDGAGQGMPLVVGTLTSNGDAHSGFKDEHGLVAIGFTNRGIDSGEVAETMRSGCHGAIPMTTAFQEAQTGVREYATAGTVRSDAPGTQPSGTLLRTGTAVRRLTPRECERLQGFPDDWTLVPYGKKAKPAADGPRYRAIGNSMAVPVMRWIGERIAMVEVFSDSD